MNGEFQAIPPKPDFAKLRLEANQCRAEGAIAAAFRCYRILQEEYPGEICSWTECLELLYSHMRQRKQVSMRDRFRVGTPRELFERAMDLCTTEADRKRLEEEWNRFWEEAAENLRRGNWILEWFGNRDEIFYPEKDLCRTHPAMDEVCKIGFQNAAWFQGHFLRYAEDRHGDGWRLYVPGAEGKTGISFVLGRQILWYSRSAQGIQEFSGPVRLDRNLFEKAHEQADYFAKKDLAEGVCPCCGARKIRMDFFRTRICDECGLRDGIGG